MTPASLRQLAGLLEARKTRDLARLEALIAEDRRLEAEIANLTGTAARDLETGIALPLAQQAIRQAWADQRIRAARRRRAEIAAGIRDARAAAARSLGKHESLESLVARAERAAAQATEARAEREAPPLRNQGT